MSAFKKLLHSDTPQPGSTSGPGGLIGKITGQGSHFPGKNDPSTEPTGSTAPGVEREGAGPEDTTAAAAPLEHARDTAGPESGGATHVGTTSVSDIQASGGKDDSLNSSSQTYTTTAASTQPTQTVASAVSSSTYDQPSSQQFPSTGGADGSGGVAAIGQTTTYSSARLTTGDPTGSVVDRESNNPMTYMQPEKGSTSQTVGETGVTSDAALAAASTAFASGKGERMPGEFPTAGYENPYKASRLDPRVDGGKADTSSAAAASKPSSSEHDAALGAGAAVGAGVAAVGASQAYSSHQKVSDTSHETSDPAPSTLTTTTDPAERSTEHSKSAASKGLDNAADVSPADATAEEEQQPGMVGRVLGAIGLTGAAGTAAAAIGLSQKDDGKAVDTSVPTQEHGPPKHYRRESIPTTAYPHGKLDYPQATAPPLGGSQPAAIHGDEEESKKERLGGTGAGLTAAGVGAGTAAGIAGGAVATHEYDKSRELKESATSQTSATAVKTDQNNRDSQGVRDDIAAPGQSVHDQTTVLPSDSSATKDESHLERNVAVGGASAVAAGGAAYAAHEYKDQKDVTAGTSLPDRTRDTTTTTDGPPVDAVAAAPGRLEGQDYTKDVPKEEDHTARNTALGVGAGAAAVGGAAYATHRTDDTKAAEEQVETPRKTLVKEDKSKSTPKDKEKKPGVLRRIFKRRKNKDTGEDEEYSTDEEDASSGSQVPHHHSDSKGRNVLGSGKTYEEASAGSEKPRDSFTGLPYDPAKDPEAARRLSHEPGANPVGQFNRGVDGAPSGGSVANETAILKEERPIEKSTGLPFDPTKDPETAQRLDQHSPEAGDAHGRSTDSAPTGGSDVVEGERRRSSTAAKIKDKILGRSSADHTD